MDIRKIKWLNEWNTTLPYLLTHSIQHSSSSEANRFSASQEIVPFHATRRFNTAFTSVRHLSLSWASSIQSIPPHPTSWRSILILFSYICLDLPSDLFPSGFPTKTLYPPLHSPIHATCPAHLILLDFITRTIFGEQYRSLISSICSFTKLYLKCKDCYMFLLHICSHYQDGYRTVNKKTVQYKKSKIVGTRIVSCTRFCIHPDDGYTCTAETYTCIYM